MAYPSLKPSRSAQSRQSHESSPGVIGGQGWVSPTILIICLLSGAEPVQAQSGEKDFVKPKLVINGLGHTAPLRSLTFSPDGKYLLSGGMDKVVHIWEFHQGSPRLNWSIRPPINRKGGWVYALAVSPPLARDGSYRVAVAGYGASMPAGDIRIYRLPPLNNVDTGDLVLHLASDDASKPIRRRQGHSGAVFGLDFSADGRYLASCGEDTTVRVWDLEADPDHRTLAILVGHECEVTRVAFLPGDRLVSAGGAGTVACASGTGGTRRPGWTGAVPRMRISSCAREFGSTPWPSVPIAARLSWVARTAVSSDTRPPTSGTACCSIPTTWTSGARSRPWHSAPMAHLWRPAS